MVNLTQMIASRFQLAYGRPASRKTCPAQVPCLCQRHEFVPDRKKCVEMYQVYFWTLWSLTAACVSSMIQTEIEETS